MDSQNEATMLGLTQPTPFYELLGILQTHAAVKRLGWPFDAASRGQKRLTNPGYKRCTVFEVDGPIFRILVNAR
jgi:hypothetical protein